MDPSVPPVDRSPSGAGAVPYLDGLERGVLRYQRCTACGAPQTLTRDACTACGAESPAWLDARGVGTVRAVTVVSRAPSDTFRALVPYTLVLVDLDEGARVMAHGEPGVAIGERVVARFFRHGGRALVRFGPTAPGVSSAATPSAGGPP